jgi:hypothetical protein
MQSPLAFIRVADIAPPLESRLLAIQNFQASQDAFPESVPAKTLTRGVVQFRYRSTAPISIEHEWCQRLKRKGPARTSKFGRLRIKGVRGWTHFYPMFRSAQYPSRDACPSSEFHVHERTWSLLFARRKIAS